jgi:hypothetical protein
MKNPHPRDVPVVRDLSPNLMVEIGRVIFSHAYVEWRLNLIVYDFLHVTKVLGRLVGRDIRPMDQFDLICDLISLKDVRTGVEYSSTEVPAFSNDPAGPARPRHVGETPANQGLPSSPR